MTAPTDAMRAAFEKWYDQQEWCAGDGDCSIAWAAWQAALESSARQPVQDDPPVAAIAHVAPGGYCSVGSLNLNLPEIRDAIEKATLCRDVQDIPLYAAPVAASEPVRAEPLLAELCAALGWQGGTIHDALKEVRRLKREKDDE